MKYLIIIVAFLIGVIVGIIIPLSIPFVSDKIVSSVEEMMETAEKMDEIDFAELKIPEANLIQSVLSIRNAKAVLMSMESGDTELAKTGLIKEIGSFYYTWTYDDKRELNDEIINELLEEIKSDSNKSEGLKKAINFIPE